MYVLASVLVSLLVNLRVNLGVSVKEQENAGGERRANADGELLDVKSVKQLAWMWTSGNLIDKLFLNSLVLVSLLALAAMYKLSCWSNSMHLGGSLSLPREMRTLS